MFEALIQHFHHHFRWLSGIAHSELHVARAIGSFFVQLHDLNISPLRLRFSILVLAFRPGCSECDNTDHNCCTNTRLMRSDFDLSTPSTINFNIFEVESLKTKNINRTALIANPPELVIGHPDCIRLLAHCILESTAKKARQTEV